MKQTREAHPFKIEAMVLLPEHLHCILRLPENDTNYSMRWGLIKKEFTKRARDVVEKMVGKAHPTSIVRWNFDSFYALAWMLFVCRRLPANEKNTHLCALCASVVRSSL
jgi:REP element-mobilizing transposase RayT